MSTIRLWHSYIGILIAPSVIFFALTGALQLFSLHEAHGDYKPPPILEKLASMHKDQEFSQKSHDDHGDADDHAPQLPGAHEEHEDEPALGTRLLKWFFLFVALAVTSSTILGLWIGLTHPRRGRVGWGLLAAGILLPIALYLI